MVWIFVADKKYWRRSFERMMAPKGEGGHEWHGAASPAGGAYSHHVGRVI